MKTPADFANSLKADELTRLRSVCGEMAKALEVFAKYYKPYQSLLSDETVAYGMTDLHITVGDLRKARAALSSYNAAKTR